MAEITFELVIPGDNQETYDNLIAALPSGNNNLMRGIIVPSHPLNLPQSFLISNLTPEISYVVDFQGEWQTAPTSRMYFVPVVTNQTITVALPYGPVTVTVRDEQGVYPPQTFLLSVVNYAVLFSAYASEITEYSKDPMSLLENSISNPLAYRLAAPMLGGLTNLIPTDLETMAALATKLLIKNLLYKPGTLGATREILSAFSASTPIFFKMQNLNSFDSPLYRSEEIFQGYEAHIWLPNSEIERWRAFCQLLNNLPQLYSLKQITEGEVYVSQGSQLRHHIFDFDSPFANSITAGLAYSSECFLRLFTLNVTVQAEHFLSFCQASYILDQLILSPFLPTDADPLGITPWSSYSLAGRFEQQFDITSTHEWLFDSPLQGAANGINQFFTLSKLPVSIEAVKIFVDGLLQKLYIDYRVSLSGNILSDAYRILSMPYGPLLINIPIGVDRPFLAPVFSSIEVRGNAPLQMLLTGVEQGLSEVSFIISHRPDTVPTDPEAIAVHYVTPKLPNSGNPGENQYGQIALTAGINSYDLTFTQPTLSIDYQLLISLTVNPMPGGDPTQVEQVFHIVRTHTQTGATIEFSDSLAANTYLNWWVIEDDSLTLERGTLLLSNGISSIPLAFSNGPYFDTVVLILQLWEINPSFINASQYLVSTMEMGPGGSVVQFSAPMDGDTYRLDYALFPARGGNFVEFFEPPLGLVEAHYDIKWPDWINTSLSPAPDGIRTEFTLPYPIANAKSLYLTLDGRLLTQGANNQYTVERALIVPLEGSLTLNSPTILGVSPTTNQLATGMTVVGDYIPTNTVIISIDSSTQITLNNAVTGTATLSSFVCQSGGLTVTFTFPPTVNQIPWVVYPITQIGQELPSSWDQGFLNYLPATNGEYATGWIQNAGAITIGDTISVNGLSFTASATSQGSLTNDTSLPIGSFVTWQTLNVTLLGVVNASLPRGFITNVGSIAINSTITWQALGVTLTGVATPLNENQFQVGNGQDADADALRLVINSHSILSGTYSAIYQASGISVIVGNVPNTFETLTATGSITTTNIAVNENYFTVGVSQNADTTSLISTINVHSILSHYYLASGGSGLAIIQAKKLGGGFYDETLIMFGFSTKTNISGDSAPCSYNSYTIYPSEYKVSVPSSNVNTILNILYFPNHPFYEGLGVNVVTTGTLPAPLIVATNYYVVNPTANTFQLSLTPYGTPITLTTTGAGYHTFNSLNIDVAASAFVFQTTMLAASGVVTLGSPVVTSILPSTANLIVGMSVTGTNIPANTIIESIDSLNKITLNANATGAATISFIAENIFLENESVRFITNGTLPSGLVADQTYYAINITQNRFQVSSTSGGSPVVFADSGTGELVVYSVAKFAAGLNQSLDSTALATEIQKHPIIGALVTTTVTGSGYITVTAIEVGLRANYPLAVTGSSITVQGLSAGEDPTGISYATSKLCYYYDAPVTTLDGLSTRLWKQYGGDDFIFTYPPTLQQEGYYISEVYPIDQHPLDSTIANLPCNYPKGIFTQGFGTQFNEISYTVDQPGTLAISTANLPVQEQPSGIVNGINTIFTLNFTSCAGQNSLMLWVDGVFQPSSKYTYTSVGSHGRITMLTPPAVGQGLWAWYLPLGASCADERVNALTGSIDGVNQTFTVPDAPWVDAPTLVVFLEGLFVLQGQDYSVINSNTQIQFFGTLAPASGQSLWAHYNLGSVTPVDNWLQVFVATTDGVTSTFMIPHLLHSQLPTSVDSVLVFLDGLNQGGNFTIEVDIFGKPTGNIIFIGVAPEANRILEVAYIRA